MKLLRRLSYTNLLRLLPYRMRHLLLLLFRLPRRITQPKPASPPPSLKKQTDEPKYSGPVEPDAYCGICMEEKYPFEMFAIRGCSHAYCAACICRHVAAKVEANEVSIRCPDPGCVTRFLEPEACRLILPQEVYDRWGAQLCESAICEQVKIYCPHKRCSALLIHEQVVGDGRVITDAECPHCSRKFCVQCRVPWHAEFTCEEYRKLGREEREGEGLMLMSLAKKRKWQRCPKCKMFVEKAHGCDYIKCR